MSRKYKSSHIPLQLPLLSMSPIINIEHEWGTLVTVDVPILVHNYNPRFIADIRVHSRCCTFFKKNHLLSLNQKYVICLFMAVLSLCRHLAFLRLWFRGFSLRGLLLLQCMGSVVAAYGFSCLKAHGIFLDRSSNPCLLHWQVDS